MLNNLCLTAVVVVTARTTPPSGIFHSITVIWFIFRRCDGGGDMLVINASNHSGKPEILIIGLLPEVTERYYQVKSFIRLASFNPISTPLTYSPVILLFNGFLPRKIFSEITWERCTLSFKSAYSGLLMCSASLMFWRKLPFKMLLLK